MLYCYFHHFYPASWILRYITILYKREQCFLHCVNLNPSFLWIYFFCISFFMKLATTVQYLQNLWYTAATVCHHFMKTNKNKGGLSLCPGVGCFSYRLLTSACISLLQGRRCCVCTYFIDIWQCLLLSEWWNSQYCF